MYELFNVDGCLVRCRIIKQESCLSDDGLLIVSAVILPDSPVSATLIYEVVTGEKFVGQIVAPAFVRENCPWAISVLPPCSPDKHVFPRVFGAN